MSGELKTWTFFGHWENGELVIEYEVEGEVQDTRDDDGTWDEGLFAASASGRTVDEAEEAVVALYVDDEDEDEGYGHGPGFEEAALKVFVGTYGYTR